MRLQLIYFIVVIELNYYIDSFGRLGWVKLSAQIYLLRLCLLRLNLLRLNLLQIFKGLNTFALVEYLYPTLLLRYKGTVIRNVENPRIPYSI